MKLLLDEHFSPEIARQLRSKGHDVVAARERSEPHALSDWDLLGIARAERRALVTENVVDFVEVHRQSVVRGEPHFGLIFTSPRQFPRTRRAIGKLIRALGALLALHSRSDALLDQVWWLEPEGRR